MMQFPPKNKDFVDCPYGAPQLFSAIGRIELAVRPAIIMFM
jgi:hypothetical protein